MYDPTLEIFVLQTSIETTFEVISEDAIQDQYLAWRDQSYGFLLNMLGSCHSEVEISAARRLLLDQDWQVKYSEFYEDAYAYVAKDGQTWTRLFKSDLRSEARQMIGLQEPELVKLFNGLIDQLDEAIDMANERDDRAYPARSAGRFAKVS
ncbi:MAG: hypothetical protein HY862_07095 [Chloroflexi bacterium]|nr:hypothetical protein [Chloroflexota bacterium]